MATQGVGIWRIIPDSAVLSNRLSSLYVGYEGGVTHDHASYAYDAFRGVVCRSLFQRKQGSVPLAPY